MAATKASDGAYDAMQQAARDCIDAVDAMHVLRTMPMHLCAETRVWREAAAAEKATSHALVAVQESAQEAQENMTRVLALEAAAVAAAAAVRAHGSRGDGGTADASRASTDAALSRGVAVPAAAAHGLGQGGRSEGGGNDGSSGGSPPPGPQTPAQSPPSSSSGREYSQPLFNVIQTTAWLQKGRAVSQTHKAEYAEEEDHNAAVLHRTQDFSVRPLPFKFLQFERVRA